jgi:LuxR family maltose regulon positive regulatory protein
MNMYPAISLENQLLATKFYVPIAPGTLIPRPRLSTLLDKRLKYPLTLVSAPAGFGKTTLLASWSQLLQASHCQVAWLSLDEEDNDPQLFWMSVLAAFQMQQPERFTSLLMQLQSSASSLPLIKSVVIMLINLLVEGTDRFVLILDDYHLITNPEVHTILAYLIEHLPTQLRLIVATRADPPLPLPQLRARDQILEVRTEQLRCTVEETRDFFQEVMGIQLPEKVIEEVTARTEGWLVGLQLLGLSLPGYADPTVLLEEVRGDQRYILDYLTETVLQRQSQEVQTFLLCTSILDQLSASLCDAVLEQHGSQQMLKRLDQRNLFLVSLDNKQEWYRYHALFAEALRSQLEQTHSDLVPILHLRASRWYAQHHQTTAAILHAFKARDWNWAADLLEQTYHSLVSFTWGANRYVLVQFQQWIEQLPADILACRPHFCLACVHLLWTITPYHLLFTWLDLAEATLRASLKEQISVQGSLSAQGQQKQMDQLGKALTLRAFLQCYEEDGQAGLVLSEQALAHLSPENTAFLAIVAVAKSIAYYRSSANDVVAAIENGYQAVLLTQEARQPAVTCCMIATTLIYLIGAGRLHQAEQLTQQVPLLETQSGSPRLLERGWVTIFQAEILRERNELVSAHSLAREAISLCEQSISLISLPFLYWGYAVQVRVCLSCGDLDAACVFLQQAEQIGQSLNQQAYQHPYSCFTLVDQVRLWLACGELERAMRWAQELDAAEQPLTPFARERQEVARARILLATDQPTTTLQRLEPVLQRATAGQRWGHVIEIRLLQALAYHRLHEEPQALAALSEAVRLGEPEGYVRSFVDEGEAMAELLCKLREKQRKVGPNPYLDRVLAAFPKQSQTLTSPSQRMAKQTQTQPLLEPLSERELQVLQLLAQGASNQKIAQELVIVIDTVKRHMSHILAKLGVQNRVQAVKRAHELGLLDKTC